MFCCGHCPIDFLGGLAGSCPQGIDPTEPGATGGAGGSFSFGRGGSYLGGLLWRLPRARRSPLCGLIRSPRFGVLPLRSPRRARKPAYRDLSAKPNRQPLRSCAERKRSRAPRRSLLRPPVRYRKAILVRIGEPILDHHSKCVRDGGLQVRGAQSKAQAFNLLVLLVRQPDTHLFVTHGFCVTDGFSGVKRALLSFRANRRGGSAVIHGQVLIHGRLTSRNLFQVMKQPASSWSSPRYLVCPKTILVGVSRADWGGSFFTTSHVERDYPQLPPVLWESAKRSPENLGPRRP